MQGQVGPFLSIRARSPRRLLPVLVYSWQYSFDVQRGDAIYLSRITEWRPPFLARISAPIESGAGTSSLRTLAEDRGLMVVVVVVVVVNVGRSHRRAPGTSAAGDTQAPFDVSCGRNDIAYGQSSAGPARTGGEPCWSCRERNAKRELRRSSPGDLSFRSTLYLACEAAKGYCCRRQARWTGSHGSRGRLLQGTAGG
jgi:hypothetical protein